MTINDILSKKLRLDVFYERFLAPNGKTVVEAEKEPLKLADLQAFPRTAQINLESGEVSVRWGEAFCFCCLENLIGRYNRSKKPLRKDIARMARMMIATYSDWSVLDLPTFVDMVVRSRIPSLYSGGSEYSLVTLDEPNIMGKVESYNRMKPKGRGASVESQAPAEKPLTKWHLTHKMGGVEYQWPDYESAWRYWKHQPNYDDPQEKAFIKAAGGKHPILPSVNEILGLQ